MINQTDRISKLSPQQLKILEMRLNKCGIKGKSSPIVKISRENQLFPLSFAQQRIWFLSQLIPDSIAYNMTCAARLTGSFDHNILHNAVNLLTQKHETLRTIFTLEDGQPHQLIIDEIKTKISVLSANNDDEVRKIAIKENEKPFDLVKGPLFRIIRIELQKQENILIISMHHIISDGWSVNLMINELIKLYDELIGDISAIPTSLPFQYVDYTCWQHKQHEKNAFEDEGNYWHQQLYAPAETLDLPYDYQRPNVLTNKGDTYKFKLSKYHVEQIKCLSKETKTTDFMILYSIFNLLLYLYTNQHDILVGVPVSGRDIPGTENLIGLFINTIVMRTQMNDNIPFLDLLNQVKEMAIKGFENSNYPLEKIISEMNIKRDLSNTPLFQVMFILYNIPAPNLHLKNIYIEPFEFIIESSKFDITLSFIENPNGYQGAMEYNTELFNKETIERMAVHFQYLLDQIINDPNKDLSCYHLITEKEKALIFSEWNNTKKDYPNICIHTVFEKRVKEMPNKIAIKFDNQQLTYQELNERANQLAHYLITNDLKCNQCIAIIAERSLEMMIGILAIIKSGCAYLPISPIYPHERIKYIVEKSDTAIVLLQSKFSYLLKNIQIDSLFLDENKEKIGAFSIDNPNLNVTPDNLCYTIFTSGSTGKPKGVMIRHESLINRLHWMQKEYTLKDNDMFLQKTPFTFDVSVWELFLWFYCGATLCFLTPEAEKDPEQIIAAIEKNNISIIHFVPTMLSAFLEYLQNSDIERIKSLKHVFCSGEALNVTLVKRFNLIISVKTEAKLYNLYGPTEATIDVSYYNCSNTIASDEIPIGKPIDNTRLYVVNHRLELQPIGVKGELCIAGIGLSTGYLNNPELTMEKYIDAPFMKSEKLYMTGDLAKWRPDGNIIFLGRNDFQVKIRGLRIELGEIENILDQHPDIINSCVTSIHIQNSVMLCAYIATNKAIDSIKLKEHLLNYLPQYMVPEIYFMMDEFPLSINGKIDREKLPIPVIEASEKKYKLPVNEIQKKLSIIWEDVLCVNRIGIDDNFFDMGGDSIKAILIISKSRSNGIQVKMQDLFLYPTISELSNFAVIFETKTEEHNFGNNKMPLNNFTCEKWDDIYSYIKNQTGYDKSDVQYIYRLMPSQERMLFYSLFNKQSSIFLQQYIMYISGDFNIDLFEKSVNKVIDRHDILRTFFIYKGSTNPLQIVLKERPLKVSYVDLSHSGSDDEWNEYIQKERKNGFNLMKDTLMRFSLLRLSEKQWGLVWSHHLIILDGWCIGIILNEIMCFYNSMLYCTSNTLPPPSPYYQYINWIYKQDYPKALQFWKEYLNGYIVRDFVKTLVRYKDEVKQTSNEYVINIDQSTISKFHAISSLNTITINTLFQLFWGLFLQIAINSNDIVFGVINSGRPAELTDSDKMLGVFVNALPVRIAVSKNDWILDIVKKMQKANIELEQYSYVSIMDIQLSLEIKRNLFDHVIAFQNLPFEMQLSNMRDRLPFNVDNMEINQQTNYALNIIIIPGDCYKIIFNYDVNSLGKDYIMVLAERLKILLNIAASNPEVRYNDFIKIVKEAWIEGGYKDETPRNRKQDQKFSGKIYLRY